ncbi:hypothetical protein ACFVT1_26515 [Streptomyces sp. NPDC057963]|uniref:hypothetical protein n=1 Tax=Streptomyces sp. NPDC057963 TaxID=3346290 RepID=UPI0036E18937
MREVTHPHGVVVANLGEGGVLLDTARPIAAFVSPAALKYLAGRPPTVEHREQYARCLDDWRAAGLVADDNGAAAAGTGLEDLRVRADEENAQRPVLTVAMGKSCGFCTQLSADLAANAAVLRDLDASVLLVEDERETILGIPPDHRMRAWLGEMGRAAGAKAGTPSALLRTPGRPARSRLGFLEVSAAFTELSGADPDVTVMEAPTTCSVNVAAQPVDTLVTARVGGRRVGIAVRGTEALEAVQPVTGGGNEPGYTPVTLTVERPGSMFLLFRGGELLARARSSEALRTSLGVVLAGYAPSGPTGLRLLAGAAVHEGGEAVLFPRNWVTDLVTHGTRLGRSGWRVCLEPFSTVRRDSGGGLVLSSRSPDGASVESPVAGVLTQALERPGPLSRSRLLAQVTNWIARPTTAGSVDMLAASLGALPVHAGTWRQAITHLTGTARQER